MDEVTQASEGLVLLELNAGCSGLLLVSKKVKSDEIIENLLTFVQDNAESRKKFGPNPLGAMDFIKRFLAKDVLSIEEDLSNCTLKI